MSNKKLLIVQPYLTNYRIVIFKKISRIYNVLLCSCEEDTYGNISTKHTQNFKYSALLEYTFFGQKLFWQSGLLFEFLNYKPDILFVTANPRYLSSWVLLVWAKLYGTQILLHGQGLYKKTKVSIFNKVVYYFYNLLCTKYICYTDSSKESLKGLPICAKCEVAENSIVNDFSIQKQDISQNGVLFIGRLRDGSNIEMLINAVSRINENRDTVSKLVLHIIGAGDRLLFYKEQYMEEEWIIFYGEVYDSSTISEISKNCVMGCYPGDAGLSVLHYMSLSLPAVVHSDLPKHMGPEASYVVNNYNGVMFERNSLESLRQVLESVLDDRDKLLQMQQNAFQTYKDISEPDLADRIVKIISSEDIV